MSTLVFVITWLLCGWVAARMIVFSSRMSPLDGSDLFFSFMALLFGPIGLFAAVASGSGGKLPEALGLHRVPGFPAAKVNKFFKWAGNRISYYSFKLGVKFFGFDSLVQK